MDHDKIALQYLAQANAQLHLDLANTRADLAVANARVQDLEAELEKVSRPAEPAAEKAPKR